MSRSGGSWLKILYTNAESLINKKGEIMVLAEIKQANIICVTESQINSDILDGEVDIPNFKSYREDRMGNKRSGGSVI